MAVIVPSLPNNLTNGTTADATQVMANFSAIVSSVNSNAANSGVNTNINQITGLTSPLSPNQGGTGLSALPANGVMLGEGTNNVNVALPGAYGTVLISNGPGVDPSFSCPYSIGDLYLSTNATNPSTKYVGTTWLAFGAGRVLIGAGTGTDINSNTLTVTGGATGGEYAHTLSVAEMPSHNHTDSGHTHTVPLQVGGGAGGGSSSFPYNGGSGLVTGTGNANIQNNGGGGSHNNVQPYIGIYIWQRTA